MNEKTSLLSSGWARVAHNKRYIVWFYLLNLMLGIFGTMAFVNQVGAILDHSLMAQRIVNGFDVGVAAGAFLQPEFGPTIVSRMPAMFFALVFFGATALFLPGVLQGYASTYRLPREDFFRACGRNLWRFVRLMFVAGIVMGIFSGILFSLQGALLKKAAESTNELLAPELRYVSLALIFLVMAVLRVWFDLAQADVVLNDQRAVRKSIGTAFKHTWRNLGALLGSYVATTIVAAVILVGGIVVWIKFVPAASVRGAFLVSQLTLLFLLIPRFWQRGVVVSYYLRHMVEPITVVPAFTAVPVSAPVLIEPVPVPAPAIPVTPNEPQAS